MQELVDIVQELRRSVKLANGSVEATPAQQPTRPSAEARLFGRAIALKLVRGLDCHGEVSEHVLEAPEEDPASSQPQRWRPSEAPPATPLMEPVREEREASGGVAPRLSTAAPAVPVPATPASRGGRSSAPADPAGRHPYSLARLRELGSRRTRASSMQLMAAAVHSHAVRYFRCFGMGPEVPPYLRLRGIVRHLHLSKPETERIIKECLVEKEKLQNRSAMHDFFYDFLVQRLDGDQAKVAEMGYNIVDALQRYAYDADCELFWKACTATMPRLPHAHHWSAGIER